MQSNQTPQQALAPWGPLPATRHRQPQCQDKSPAVKRIKESAADKRLEKSSRFWEHVVPDHTAQEEAFRHSGWRGKRARVRSVLVGTGLNEFARMRFDACGSEMRVEWSEKLQRHRVTANYCKCRHCEPCMRARSTKVRVNLIKKLKDSPDLKYRLATFTIKHSDSPLADQLKKLYTSFSKLRQTKLWKESQRGGASICEVKLGHDRKWHPHLHVICEGNWIDQRRLADAWKAITTDSHVVDVRILSRAQDAANYLCKYVTKGCSDNVWHDRDRAQEWVLASKSLRICGTFGTWRGYALTEVEATADDWSAVCSMTSLYARAAAGEEHAKHLIKLLRGDLTTVLEEPGSRNWGNDPPDSHHALEFLPQ